MMFGQIPFLPPFLNAVAKDGTRSKGPAVLFLQFILQILHGLGFLDKSVIGETKLELTAVYDDPTIIYVKALQSTLGFPAIASQSGESYQDGNFGPATRGEFSRAVGAKIQLLPQNAFQGKTIYVDGDGELKEWPESSSTRIEY